MRETSRRHGRARQMRGELSLPEVLLWQALRRRSPDAPSFRRQHPVGPYVLDFFCARLKLAVEVDGEAHNRGDRPERDQTRDAYLMSVGIRVVRIAAAEVLRDVDSVALGIVDLVRAPPQSSGLAAG
jgi:very-short-patch-repair endonuclease